MTSPEKPRLWKSASFSVHIQWGFQGSAESLDEFSHRFLLM